MNIVKPHVSLNVPNIDASVAFYEKVFGVTATKRRPGYAKFDLQAPSLNLTMQEAPRTGVNASHFGVQVASTEDVAVAWTRFKEPDSKPSPRRTPRAATRCRTRCGSKTRTATRGRSSSSKATPPRCTTIPPRGRRRAAPPGSVSAKASPCSSAKRADAA